MKNNLARIAEKIKDNCLDVGMYKAFRIYDMSRVTITVDKVDHMKHIYQVIDDNERLFIIKLQI